MRILFLTVAIAYNFYAFGCCGRMPNIENSFNRSDIVFYGRHLEGKLSDYFLSNGKALRVENFEVIRLYKGGSPDRLINPSRKYIISVSSLCEDYSFSPMCFNPNHHYLIYASISAYTGIMTIDECGRQREIKNEQFRSSFEYDRDFGKDEHKKLQELAHSNQTNNQSFVGILERQAQEISELKDSRMALKSELFKFKLAVYSLFALMVLEILGLRWIERSKLPTP